MRAAPKVSILMACYNAERFVDDALASVAAQTYANLEVVIVDDGSTDKSAEIIGRHAGKQVRLAQQSNQGAARARNAALRLAEGDYVLFLDADDLIAPSHLESLVRRATECPGCISLSRWDRFRDHPAEARFPDRPTERDLSGPEWLELDWRDTQPMTQSGMLLLPRRLLEERGGWNERLSLNDDFEFFARMISACAGIRFAPGARLYYRSNIPGSLSGRKSRLAVESAHLSLDLGTRHLLDANDTASTRRVCANLWQNFEYSYFPLHSDLRARAREHVAELGGADVAPAGPPGFHRLRRLVGWKVARLTQLAVTGARARRARPVHSNSAT